MDTTLSHGEDGALCDSLAGLVGHLRGRPQGGASGEALHADADRFVGRLAQHLWYAEEVLFPALRELEPGSSGDIEALERDHRLLHLYARDLGLQLRDGGKDGSVGVARSFLAVLLDHLHRETEGVDRMVRSLDSQRLSRALGERLPAGDGEAVL